MIEIFQIEWIFQVSTEMVLWMGDFFLMVSKIFGEEELDPVPRLSVLTSLFGVASCELMRPFYNCDRKLSNYCSDFFTAWYNW